MKFTIFHSEQSSKALILIQMGMNRASIHLANELSIEPSNKSNTYDISASITRNSKQYLVAYKGVKCIRANELTPKLLSKNFRVGIAIGANLYNSGHQMWNSFFPLLKYISITGNSFVSIYLPEGLDIWDIEYIQETSEKEFGRHLNIIRCSYSDLWNACRDNEWMLLADSMIIQDSRFTSYISFLSRKRSNMLSDSGQTRRHDVIDSSYTKEKVKTSICDTILIGIKGNNIQMDMRDQILFFVELSKHILSETNLNIAVYGAIASSDGIKTKASNKFVQNEYKIYNHIRQLVGNQFANRIRSLLAMKAYELIPAIDESGIYAICVEGSTPIPCLMCGLNLTLVTSMIAHSGFKNSRIWSDLPGIYEERYIYIPRKHADSKTGSLEHYLTLQNVAESCWIDTKKQLTLL